MTYRNATSSTGGEPDRTEGGPASDEHGATKGPSTASENGGNRTSGVPEKGRTDELREAQRRALLSAPASPENDAAQDAWEAAWTPESTDLNEQENP